MTAACRYSLGCVEFPLHVCVCMRGAISRNGVEGTVKNSMSQVQRVAFWDGRFLVVSVICRRYFFVRRVENLCTNEIILCWWYTIYLFVSREPLPTMFSMLHPLDEITPLVCKSGSKCIYKFFHMSCFLSLGWGSGKGAYDNLICFIKKYNLST